MLSDGFILQREDRREKDIYIQFIDFTGLESQCHTKRDDWEVFRSSTKGLERKCGFQKSITFEEVK
jgi:hypothetical protein